MSEGARILIIDDNLINRKKLSLACANLGYATAAAESGKSGVAALSRGGFDAVLLDILMPGMDGFEVLRVLKSDEMLCDLPVIVISDLEGETRSVSQAIELGAEDFLPKDFDPVILNARLKACLRKKFFREQELEYFRRINVLTDAAARVETGHFDRAVDDLTNEARNPDPIGRLALVFQGMAREIHSREVKLLHRIRTLQGGILLIICGGCAGLLPSLSRMSAEMGANPIGMAFWVDLMAVLLCAMGILARGNLPRISAGDLGFFLIWAFVVGILQHISIFVLAAHVQATFLTLVLALEGLIVFAVAALMRLENPAPRRMLGLLVGLAGVGLSLYQRMEGNALEANLWLIGALIAPCLYAFETIAVAARRPAHVDPVTAVGIMFGFSTLLALVLSVGTGNFMPVDDLRSTLGLVIGGIGIVTVVVNVTFFWLLKLGGGVFTSQKAYVTAIAGVLWGIAILGETMSPLAWLAIGMMLIGMYLVESKAVDEPIVIKRDFAV